MALLFVGIAASSAFQHVMTPTLQVGQTAQRRRLRDPLRPPDGDISTRDGRLEKINLGSDLTVRKDGKLVTRLHTERGYYPTDDSSLGVVSRYFEGEQTSEVGLKAGARHDVWTRGLARHRPAAPDHQPGRQGLRQGQEPAAADGRRAARHVFDTYFLTGTDEHGQKIERAAQAAGKTPQQLTDEVSAEFRALWDRMGLTYDDFIRTTSDRHKQGVQALWRRIRDNGYIYKGSYTGQYCVFDELYVDVVGDGRALSGMWTPHRDREGRELFLQALRVPGQTAGALQQPA